VLHCLGKDKKKIIIIIIIIIVVIIITGLHNRPEGCSASVSSAAGPFSATESGVIYLLQLKG
jgi:flagellar basal body-associated protein FliL